MRRGYAVLVPRGGLPKVGVQRVFSRSGFHGFPAASTWGDTGDIAGDGCAVETVRSGTLIGRMCLLQWTLYEEQALNSASKPRIQRILIIPP